MPKPNNWLSLVGEDERVENFTSQRGEDRILQKVFKIIGEGKKWCVEFGAMDGKHFANTWYWINKRGWSSVQIEGARDHQLNLRVRGRDSFDALEARYKNREDVYCINDMVEVEGDRTLDKHLATTPIPKDFDLLSIDVDGADWEIWNSLINYRPRIVVIEHNKMIPIGVSFHSLHGSSLRAHVELGKQKGYELIAANDLNGIFVVKELFEQFEIADNSPEQLWQGHEKFRINLVEGADGSLRVEGDDRVRWTRGADGTLTGQLRSGRVVARDEQLPAEPWQPKTYASGWVRHWWHQIWS